MPTIKKKKVAATVTKKITPRVIKSVEIKPEKISVPPMPSLRLYRRIVGGFIAAVVVVLGAVILLSTTKATIQVVPLVKDVEASFLVDVVKENAVAGQINGVVVEQIFEQTKSFPVIGSEQKEVLDKAGGEVTIINNSSRNQPLVSTTRFLSSGGVLFRLDNSVVVPAGGKVTATVHADQIGSTGDIGPDKFTIPGLVTSLQSQIYAESTAAMTGGRRMVSVITQGEIDKNVSVLMTEILDSAKTQLRSRSKANFTSETFSSEIISQTSDTQSGEEKDSIVIAMKIKVIGIFFDGTALDKIAGTKLYENLADGFVFKNLSEGIDSTVDVADVRSDLSQASLRVSAEQSSIVSNTSAFLQPEVLAGKTLEEIKNYLVSAGVAGDVQINFFPPWVKTVPKMLDQISVEVLE